MCICVVVVVCVCKTSWKVLVVIVGSGRIRVGVRAPDARSHGAHGQTRQSASALWQLLTDAGGTHCSLHHHHPQPTTPLTTTTTTNNIFVVVFGLLANIPLLRRSWSWLVSNLHSTAAVVVCCCDRVLDDGASTGQPAVSANNKSRCDTSSAAAPASYSVCVCVCVRVYVG